MPCACPPVAGCAYSRWQGFLVPLCTAAPISIRHGSSHDCVCLGSCNWGRQREAACKGKVPVDIMYRVGVEGGIVLLCC